MQKDLFDAITLLEDLQQQDPSLPIKPKTQALRQWVRASLKHYNAKAETLSLSKKHSVEVRQNWLELMIEAAEAGVEEPPITLFIQACPYPITNPNLRNMT